MIVRRRGICREDRNVNHVIAAYAETRQAKYRREVHKVAVGGDDPVISLVCGFYRASQLQDIAISKEDRDAGHLLILSYFLPGGD